MKRLITVLLIVVGIVLLAAGIYVAYAMITYYRLPDNIETVFDPDEASEPLKTGEEYAAVTWNLGFGAYSADYSFFMDGGTQSWAFSKEAVHANLGHAFDVLKGLNPDFMLLQEVDEDATRTYHVNEAELARQAFGEHQAVFTQNYDSPFLFYPFLQPHGASKSGLVTLSNAHIERAVRRSLPVETGLTRFLDLDRCYVRCELPVENGRKLCLYNLHLSAYTSDGTIADDQLAMLMQDMLADCEAGNYAVAGGDFNKDLLGNSPEVFGVSGADYPWAQPLKQGAVPEGLTVVSSLDADNPIPSCRNADEPYAPGHTFVLTVDGFIVSNNVTVNGCRVIDEAFACSDHNPVELQFTLEEAK